MINFRSPNVAMLCIVLFFSLGCSVSDLEASDEEKSPTKPEQQKVWTTYSTEDGLALNLVASMAVDADNVKWFGTLGGGLLSFDGTTWKTYTTKDGLIGNDVKAMAVDGDNVKWIGTGDGVLSFDERQ